MLTSEFQSAILLKCQDETELSLVEYLSHGQGLRLLQMLYILASKVMIVQNKLFFMCMYINIEFIKLIPCYCAHVQLPIDHRWCHNTGQGWICFWLRGSSGGLGG